MECSICKEKIELPHMLPCNDTFCYLCIKRHLMLRSYCPVCFTMPVNSSDLISLVKNENNMLPEIKVPLKFKQSESVLKRELKKYQLILTGDYNRMVWRLKEYFLIYSAEKLKSLSKSPTDIARQVHRNEGLIFKKEILIDKEMLRKYFHKLKEKIKKLKNRN
ncbi:zinc finger domain-containing protein [Tubulinosema ratisbonensis]|uniref:Zinc finger domain-containing protein n=1 Tax=Tubulinosema ratisbonensis TaxID=291195 RepID=A0A437AHM8_9MICR|nr:zinc finger domain-containing protein [Tubulinosema ratisbonensis]